MVVWCVVKKGRVMEWKKRMKHAFPFFTPHNTTHYQNLDFKWMKEEKEQSEQQCVLPSQSITIVVPFVLLVVFHSHSYIFVSLFLFSSPSSHFNYNETERNGVKAWIKVNKNKEHSQPLTWVPLCSLFSLSSLL